MTPAKDRVKYPTWSMSKEKRFAGRNVGTPGPGAYRAASWTDAGPKFSNRVKPVINPFKMKTDPGPGFYDPIKPKLDTKYSISQRLGASSYAAAR